MDFFDCDSNVVPALISSTASRTSFHFLQIIADLPAILSMWIVDNLFEELDLPNPPNPSSDEHHFEDQCGRKWSLRMLNFILQQVLEQDIDGTQLAATGAIEH